MRSDHRHELKTNELADWLAHFPEWAAENRTTLIATGAVVVVAIGVYFVKFYRRDVTATRQEVRLTNLVAQLPRQEDDVAQSLSQGVDKSIALLPTAQDLQDFAQTAESGEMAAMALIKRAEALRAELHYRLASASREEVARQIAQAQASYREALERAPSVPALAAAAQFGLGLCEEELGKFDEARKIYRQVAQDAAYEGTAARAAAAHRLTTMDDYKTAVVFKSASPKPATSSVLGARLPGAQIPGVQMGPGAANTPIVIEGPPATATEAVPNTPVPAADEAVREAVREATPTPVPEANEPAGN